MPSTPRTGRPLFVEPLESRIAPTGLVAITNPIDPNNPTYTSQPGYINYTYTAPGSTLHFVPASQYGINTPDVYALKLTGNGTVGSNGLSTGDELVIFNSAEGFNYSHPFIQATNGTVVAFFTDLNHDGQVETNELTGIALAKGGAVSVNGNVNGDVAVNLSTTGALTKALQSDAALTGLTVVGNVNGYVLSGGNISNVSISGNVDGIRAGTAINGSTYHFAQNSSGTEIAGGTLSVAPGAGIVGASIDDVSVVSISNAIHAGTGGLGAAGGSLTTIQVLGDTDGFTLLAGTGGGGATGIKGGVGGDVSGVIVSGVPDTGTHATITIEAGAGGANALGKGGAGGSVSDIATSVSSYDAATNTAVASADQLNDNILVEAGAGGSGHKGGNGGDITNSQIYGAIPDVSGETEIQVIAGAGGVGSSGKGGFGGSVSQVGVQNLAVTVDADTSSILIEGGAGTGGKSGGDVQAVTALGAEITIEGGTGASGNGRGGDGGSLNTITIESTSAIFAHQVTLTGGNAGSAAAGFGGIGGEVTQVTMTGSELDTLTITGGNGGNGPTNIGGDGGALTDITLADSAPGLTDQPVVTIHSGNGGSGSTAAGVGGDINTFQLLGTYQVLGTAQVALPGFSFAITSGTGGSILSGGKGDGGQGGDLINVGVSNEPLTLTGSFFASGGTGSVTAGAGGNGTLLGGNGGALSQVSLRAIDSVTLQSGKGGSGGMGAGGDVTGSAANSLFGAVSVTAGNGGAGGQGGGISGFVAAAETNISLIAGNGDAGGAGGDVANSGTSLNELTESPNQGNLTVTAGNGSTGNGVAGAGGSISTFSGYVGQSDGTTRTVTALTAGTGGGSAKITGAGGSVSDVKLTGTSSPFGSADPTDPSEIIVIDAGSAGASGGIAKKGGAGGSVNTVTIYNLDTGALVQHIAAGDGVSGTKKGGAGGSISDVSVGTVGDGGPDDIGFRSGVKYGYGTAANQYADGAGGLFAGAGGSGAKINGLPGSVTDITATAIASIVAGKGAAPDLANVVDGIDLEGLTTAIGNSDGSFANFSSANLVGSVYDPAAANASTYVAGTDGLIAAIDLTSNRNFVPEAVLEPDGSGGLIIADLREPGGIVFIAG